MKRKLLKLVLGIAGVCLVIAMLNISVTTKQGIDYSVYTLRMPLYLKILDFFDRHYNYKLVVKRITSGSGEEKDRILRIFKWTHENIKKIPQGFPVIDDHVWHIIVRGYGMNDQSADVFTTLCNYAGADAFFNWIEGESSAPRLPLSFVKISGRWNVFDPYNGIFFINSKGYFADIEEIIKGDWQMESVDALNMTDVNYAPYLRNLQLIKNSGLSRANTQSPLNRLRCEIKKWLRWM